MTTVFFEHLSQGKVKRIFSLQSTGAKVKEVPLSTSNIFTSRSRFLDRFIYPQLRMATNTRNAFSVVRYVMTFGCQLVRIGESTRYAGSRFALRQTMSFRSLFNPNVRNSIVSEWNGKYLWRGVPIQNVSNCSNRYFRNWRTWRTLAVGLLKCLVFLWSDGQATPDSICALQNFLLFS